MTMGGMGWAAMRSFSQSESVTRQRLAPGTVRRIAGYARPYKRQLAFFIGLVVLSSLATVASPLLLKSIIDRGVQTGRTGLVIGLAGVVAGIAVAEAVVSLSQRWMSSRIGEGLIYDLRSEVFDHVQRMPIAFFTRTQTGSLISRLNSDVIGAQRAITSTLSSVVANVLSLVVVLATMLLLSWQITLIALVLLPMFILPAKYIGRRLQRITREQMQLDAEMSSLMTERFNVSGAMLAKLYGRPAEESRAFSGRAARVRDIGVTQATYGGVFFTALTLLTSLATALVYGLGGALAVQGSLQIGTLVALATLLVRLYGPLTSLSNVHVDVMTALVSFDRVFEILDLKPMIDEKPEARELTVTAGPDAEAESDMGAVRDPAPVGLEFDHVSFAYPAPEDVSLASLESIARPEQGGATPVLHDVSFTAEPGHMVALVGPSGAGKTTITHLAARLYDPDEGTVRIGGQDLRDLTFASLRDTVGVVTQDAHLYHDTIRANLAYARPDASDDELLDTLRAAHIADLVENLPDGLDTVVGERGYRMSGGEKQRLAIARLLLKAPSVVVLDEATAHLDSESEVAVQRALQTALSGRTSLVIAHRLSTIREADEILVTDGGRIAERGTHAELLAREGLYAELYETQFARQDGEARPAPVLS